MNIETIGSFYLHFTTGNSRNVFSVFQARNTWCRQAEGWSVSLTSKFSPFALEHTCLGHNNGYLPTWAEVPSWHESPDTARRSSVQLELQLCITLTVTRQASQVSPEQQGLRMLCPQLAWPRLSAVNSKQFHITTDWKRSVFIPVPKKGNAKECSNYCTVALISHASKVMLKILQARL